MSLLNLKKEFEDYKIEMGFKFDDRIPSSEISEKRKKNYDREIINHLSGKPIVNLMTQIFDDLDNELSTTKVLSVKDSTDIIIQDLKVYVEKTYKELGYEIPENILVEQNPAGLFNASFLTLPSGYVIFINAGLIYLIHKIHKLIAWHVVHLIEGEDSTNSIIYWLELYIDGYLSNGFDVSALPSLEGIPKALLFEFGLLLRGAEFFVLAHEYAHFFNRDKENENEKYFGKLSDNNGILKNLHRHLSEHEADDTASIALLNFYYSQNKEYGLEKEKHEKSPELTNILAGGLLTHIINNLIMEIYALKTNKITHLDENNKEHQELLRKVFEGNENLDNYLVYSTHPNSIKRYNEICEFLVENLSTNEFKACLIYPEFLYDLTPYVIDSYKRKYI